MIEIINSVSQAFSITFLPVLGILIKYHYTREREKNITLTAQNEIMSQLVAKISQQSVDVDHLVRCVRKQGEAIIEMDTMKQQVLKGLAKDINTLGRNVEHLHVENKEEFVAVADIGKHLMLTETRIEDCKNSLIHLHTRFDSLK